MFNEEQQEFLDSFKEHPDDTGSASYQIAALTLRMDEIGSHLEDHPKDHASRRGLLKLNGQRKGFLAYLKRKNVERFTQVMTWLKGRKRPK